MFSYTRQDYLELEKIFCNKTNILKDIESEYHYDISKEEQKKINEKHQRHDKIVRDILNDKEEVIKIINKYVNVENELKKEEIEKYETRYITKNYQNKEADIVYKLKGKEVYFLLEHQTKVEKAMAYRMAEYSLEIMRSRIENKIYEQTKYPRVIPIVIYTGKPKWTAERFLNSIQEEYKIKSNKSQLQLGYNLIDIRNKEKAIEDDLLISKISILEKAKNTEEILEIIDKIAKKITNEGKRENLKRIVEYLLDDKILKDEMEEIKEKLKNEERDDIMRVHEVIRRDRENYAKEYAKGVAKEARKEGVQTGLKNGKLEQAILDAQKMLAEKLDVNLIMRITGLKKEQFMK